MIHYHGTPIGGTRIDAARFLMGRHALVSFHRPDDLPIVMEACQSFVLDNGAFSKWKSGGGDVDCNKYMEWLESIDKHPGLDWYVIPDKIDGAEADNRKLIEEWPTNKLKAEGVPVWHPHESLEWLITLTKNFKTVAFGGSPQYKSPGSNIWWVRMKEAMNSICDENGKAPCKLHGLRMLNPKVFSKLPLSSADSTNAAIHSGSVDRFGLYKPVTRGQRAQVIAERIESHNSAEAWNG